jgi:hypothetical protein
MSFLKNLFSLGALKSKTVWLGVAQIVYPAVEAWLTGAPFNYTTVVTGVLTILARATTEQPLSAK